MERAQSPQCEHNSCDYEQRLEYCPAEANGYDGSGWVIVEILDELLDEHGDFRRDGFIYNGEDREFNRQFSYLHGDTMTWAWPLMETAMDVTHTRASLHGSDSYQIDLSWQVHQVNVEGAYRKRYIIDCYPEGAIQAMVEEPALEAGLVDGVSKWERRSPTSYDYEQLFDVLELLRSLRSAEIRDDELADVQ